MLELGGPHRKSPMATNKNDTKRQPSFETTSNYAMLNAQVSSPGPNTLRFAAIREVDHFASILTLFKRRCPAAVSRFVVPVIVDAVDAGSSEWSCAHIVQEVDKGESPAVAYDYASCAVVVVLRVASVVAPGLHQLPSRVLRRLMATALRLSSAATRLSTSLAKVATGHYGRAAAIAMAKPHSLFSGGVKLFYGELSVGFPSLVFDSPVECDRVALSHLNLSCRFELVRAVWKRQTSGLLALFSRCHILHQEKCGVS